MKEKEKIEGRIEERSDCFDGTTVFSISAEVKTEQIKGIRKGHKVWIVI